MKFFSKYSDFSLILEGGAAGHIMHPFEDFHMSFSELKSLIDNSLSGKLNMEEKPTEKMDGISLSMSYRRGEVVFARGITHIRSKGAEALNLKGIISKFKTHKQIADVIKEATSMLDQLIKSLPIKYVRSIFKNGSVFATIEIIAPDTTNVIPYGRKLLIIHDLVEYDLTGKVLNRSNFVVPKLISKLEKILVLNASSFSISGPNTLELVKHKNYDKLKNKFINNIDVIKGNLTDEQTIGNYLEIKFKEHLLKVFNSYNIDFNEDVISRLSKRLAYDDKKIIGLLEIRKDYPEMYPWFKSFGDKKALIYRKKFLKPLENLILSLGMEVLRQISSVMILSDDNAVVKIREELEKIINSTATSSNSVVFSKAEIEIEKLKALGGLDAILPTEGLVFKHKGKYYKLTGSFAPINQLLGILRYSR